MTEYDATQKQRAFERRIRATKRELTMLDTGIKETDNPSLKESLQVEFDRKSVLLKKQEAKIKDFTHQTGLYRDRAREQSYGFNKSVSQKAVHKAEKHYQTWIHDIGAKEIAPKTLAEYYKNKYNDTWEHQMLMGYNKAIKEEEISVLIGFDKYLEFAYEANEKLIGVKTVSGHTVEAYATHFINRVIGQVSTSHKNCRVGVPIDSVLECLTSSNTRVTNVYIRTFVRDGEIIPDERIDFIGEKCSAAFSITENKLIQTNKKS